MADPERDRIRRTLEEFLGLGLMPHDGADLLQIRRLSAAVDSCIYLDSHMADCPHYPSALHLLEASLPLRPERGLVLEFGVDSGRTINFIAERVAGTVYGFDSFDGLPEDWRPDFPLGSFRRSALPEVRDNVVLAVGWFDATLPDFIRAHPAPVAFLHVDCDLYSSTRTILHYLRGGITTGTVIVFDEYFNYVGWRHHEYKAFQEFIAATGLDYRYLGVVPGHQQVAVQIR